MTFVAFLGHAHLNSQNVAVYQSGDRVTAKVENVLTGKSYGARTFDSQTSLDAWYARLPGTGLGRLYNAMCAILDDD